MKVPSLRALSVSGMALLIGCGNSTSGGGLGSDNGSRSADARSGAGSRAPSTADSSNGGSQVTVPMTDTAAGANAIGASAGGSTSATQTTDAPSSRASVAGTSDGGESIDEGVIGTYDPPAPAAGGEGNTSDPPVGDTADPPVGDAADPPVGDTADPPVGDTGDPPVGDTGDPPVGDTGDPPPGETPDPPTDCTLTEIDKVNVIVFEDATPTGADAEGRMWIGGDLTINGGYAVNTTDITALTSSCDDWGLVVNGNITGDPIVKAGKAAYGGTFKGNASIQSNCGIFHQKPIDFDALETKLTGYSAAFKEYPANGTSTLTYGKLVLTGTDKTLNIFSVTAEELSSITNLTFKVPTTSTVIVNVSGKSINWQGGSFTLPDGGQACKANNTAWCHRILYNMYEAESVTINGIGIQGSILAPSATFNGLGGNVDGQLIVRYLKGVTEYHPYYFSGCWLLPKPKG